MGGHIPHVYVAAPWGGQTGYGLPGLGVGVVCVVVGQIAGEAAQVAASNV